MLTHSWSLSTEQNTVAIWLIFISIGYEKSGPQLRTQFNPYLVGDGTSSF